MNKPLAYTGQFSVDSDIEVTGFRRMVSAYHDGHSDSIRIGVSTGFGEGWIWTNRYSFQELADMDELVREEARRLLTE